MKNILLFIIYLLIGLALLWGVLTYFSERSGSKQIALYGEADAPAEVLLVYDPDPFYNFDEQICTAIAKSLEEQGWFARVATVKATEYIDESTVNLYILCSNTYNWAPDKAISDYIEKHPYLKNKAVAAITLGSGSTERSKQLLEEKLGAKDAKLISSESYWLMRPNDKSQIDSSNVKVALEMARDLGSVISREYYANYSFDL